MDNDTIIIELILFALFVLSPAIIGVTAGTVIDRSHRRGLAAREAAVFGGPAPFIVTNMRALPNGAVFGEAVFTEVSLSIDYFRSFTMKLRKIIGGRLGTYERLLDRLRREATLRIVEQARDAGFDGVCNIRFENVDLGQAIMRRKKLATIACLVVTATAYSFEAPAAAGVGAGA